MPSLLVVDDEHSVRYSISCLFQDEDLEVRQAATAREALDELHRSEPDVVLLDLQLPDASGLEVFQKIQEQNPRIPVIFLTAHGTTDTALEAMKRGAFEYLIKPVDLARLTEILNRALQTAQLTRSPSILAESDTTERMVGRTSIMQEMCKCIGRIAPQDVNVLILGESGTGKELVARAIFLHGKRAHRPFLAINCAAIPEQLLESELFGHEKGAFTGADRQRIGKFEQCDQGTLFLDEIGDMALPLQSKILRVLQDQQFERVGGNQTVRTSVRIVAASNQELERLVETGRFRKDLYFTRPEMRRC